MNTTKLGKILEQEVYDYFSYQIDNDLFWARKSCCKIYRQKGYYSKDRDSDIIFDIAIEIWLPNASSYSMLILIECKNYNSKIPVDAVEEFYAKINQVAPAKTKGVLASSAAFQSGTLIYAKSKGIGIIRFLKDTEPKWELYRTPSSSLKLSVHLQDEIHQILTQEESINTSCQFYFQSPLDNTISLKKFIEDLILESSITPQDIALLKLNNKNNIPKIPYLSKETLEKLSAKILAKYGYSKGEINLYEICYAESASSKLKFILGAIPSQEEISKSILGRISFQEMEIKIYTHENPNPARERFTLAHELAHYFLNHGRYLIKEYCNETDFSLTSQNENELREIKRLEYQANF